MIDGGDYRFPEPIPVFCWACDEFVGTFMYSSELRAGVEHHNKVCTADEDNRRQAAFDVQFARIAVRLIAEGFPCQ